MHVGVISGSRADRGPLRVVYDAIREANHRASWIDLTHCQPATDNVGSPVTCAIRTGMATRETVAELIAYSPDWVIVLGDRYEILGATVGAYVAGFPIAHLDGGDITEGSQDDCMRHAITKLAHIHFPTNPDSAGRIIGMGEEPSRVHSVGCAGVDRILRTRILPPDEAFRAIGLPEAQRALLVGFHPNTLGDTKSEAQALYEALEAVPEDVSLILIAPNQDANHEIIRACWTHLAQARKNTVYRLDLPDEVYLSLMKHCAAMVGNSSAGFYEAPTLGIPVVNIGNRQKGRIKSSCILDCDATTADIETAIFAAMARPNVVVRNPYGDGLAAKRVAYTLAGIDNPKSYLTKRFYVAEAELVRPLMG